MFIPSDMFSVLEQMSAKLQLCEDIGCVFITADPMLPVVCNDCDGKPSLTLWGIPDVSSKSQGSACPTYFFRVGLRLAFCMSCVDDADSSADFAQEVYRFLGSALNVLSGGLDNCLRVLFDNMFAEGVSDSDGSKCMSYRFDFVVK
jgi:hypothetical protein